MQISADIVAMIRRGTFVQHRSVECSAGRIRGFTRNRIEAGRVPSTRLLSARVVPRGSALSIHGRKYRLAGPVCRIERLRLADGGPMIDRKREMDLFELTDVLPAFRVEGVTFIGNGAILEIADSLYRGDLYSFSVQARR